MRRVRSFILSFLLLVSFSASGAPAETVLDEFVRRISDLAGRVEEVGSLAPIEFGLFQTDAVKKSIEALRGAQGATFAHRWGVVQALSSPGALSASLTQGERDEIAFAASRFIGELNLVFSHVLAYDRFAVPLKDAQVATLELLDLLGTPQSRRLFLMQKTVLQSELAWMKRGYMAEWLGWLKESIFEASKADFDLSQEERKKAGWDSLVYGGGVFKNLGVSGTLSHWREDRAPEMPSPFLEEVPSNPLVLLGYSKSAPEAKQQMIQFIRETDPVIAGQVLRENTARQFESFFERSDLPLSARAQALEFWKTDDLSGEAMRAIKDRAPDLEYVLVDAIKDHLARTKEDVITTYRHPFPVFGNALVDQLLRRLVSEGRGFAAAPGFSLVTYYGNVAEILTDLVESTSFSNAGTYYSVLEAALELPQAMSASFFQAPHKKRALAEKTAALATAIERKLLRLLRESHGKDPVACVVLLSAR